MERYDIDFEIVYAVKSEHTFDKIFSRFLGGVLNKKTASRATFSKHLSQLVEVGIIQREIKDGKPYYELGENEPSFQTSVDIIARINNELSTIVEKSKIIPPKKLLQDFIADTKENCSHQKEMRFENLFLENIMVRDGDDYSSIITMNEKQIKMIDKLIKLRFDILLQRDKKLYEMFIQLVL